MPEQSHRREVAEQQLEDSRRIFTYLDWAFDLCKGKSLTFAMEVQALRTRAGAMVDRDERAVARLEALEKRVDGVDEGG